MERKIGEVFEYEDKKLQVKEISIGCDGCFFDRQYNKAFQLRSDIEGKAIFGEQTNKNAYGWDCLNGFFANLKGASGSIFVLSPVGTDLRSMAGLHR